MLPIREILHPTDFTEQAQFALELACALARDNKARLVLLHVVPIPVYPVVEGGVYPVAIEVRREEFQEKLNEIEVSDANIRVERVLTEGDPASEILRVAAAYQSDLIVMGTHGRGGLSRLVMGSVAEAVSRKAECPVLTVRTKVGVAGPLVAETAHETTVAAR